MTARPIGRLRQRRSYDATGRQTKALETRGRVAACARKLFTTRGYAATSIEAIAEAAGVAPQTFYAAFRSKSGVLLAVLDAADTEAGVPELRKALSGATGDSARQIALLVSFCARFYERNADLIGIARAAGQTEPDLANLAREGEGRRRSAQEPLVRAWARSGELRLKPPKAALDVLWAMTGADWYHLLVEECRWTVAQYEKWLTAALVDLLLKDFR